MYCGQALSRRGKLFARLISHVCKTRSRKISTIYCNETFSDLGLNGRVVENLTENWPYLGNGDR